MSQETLTKGLFLIRYSENKETGYALSVLDFDDKDDFHVVHFQIAINQNGILIDSSVYSTLSEAINSYKRKLLQSSIFSDFIN